MQIKTFTFNPVQENTYLLYDHTGQCAIVDAGCYTKAEFETLDNFIQQNKLTPVKLINTHCHFDHIMGVTRCRLHYKLKWEAHIGDQFLIENAPIQGDLYGIPMEPVDLPDILLNQGDTVQFGNTTLQVIHVPGHSKGSICFYNAAGRQLITGDVLFYGSIGRTDLPGGNMDTLLTGIKSKLLTLPNDVTAYPGHGPKTTIENEKANNPFLQ